MSAGRLHFARKRWKGLHDATARWQALPARDRLAVGAAVVAMALLLSWLVFARPALDSVTRWQRELPRLRAQSAELDRLLSDVPAARAPATASASEAPQAGLDRAGLQGLYRIDTLVADAPPGAGKPPPAKAWRIEFSEPVPATRVFPWLLDVAARADLEVTGIAIDRADAPETSGAQAPGRVRGVVDLQSTPLYKDGP